MKLFNWNNRRILIDIESVVGLIADSDGRWIVLTTGDWIRIDNEGYDRLARALFKICEVV